MSSFIISFDSYYRNAFQYRNPASYDIIVNPYTPSGSSTSSNSTFEVDNPIFTSFSWAGTVTYPIQTLGYTSTIPGNAKHGRCSRIFSLAQFEIEMTDRVATVDYYVGCIFVLYAPAKVESVPPVLYQTGIVSGYNPITNIVRIQTGLDVTFVTEVIARSQEFPTSSNYYLINPSGSEGHNLVILGLNSFLSETDENYISDISLKNAPTADMWVQNLTKDWVAPIVSINDGNRNAQLPDGYPFDLSDLFVLRKTDAVFSVTTVGAPVSDTVDDTVILSRGASYTVGTVYIAYRKYIENDSLVDIGLRVRVTAADPADNGLVSFEWTAYSSVQLGTILQVGGAAFPDPALLKVISITSLMIPISVQDGERTERFADRSLFTVFIPILFQPILRSFAKYRAVKYVYDPLRTTRKIGALLVLDEYTGDPGIRVGTAIQYVAYSTNPVGIIAPTIGYQQGVCYKISLISLILPNQPVKGIDQLPSFFPYFMLQLYNTNRITGSTNILYSNNPNTQRVTFFCPVGNPRNQLISTYVVVRSTQINYMKWTSLGNLHIEIVLPDGTVLEYAENARINDLIVSYNDLNLPYQAFVLTLMSQIYEPHIVANFEFQIMT